MSAFHESIRSFIEDVHLFLKVTLKEEVLSPTCSASKDDLLKKMIHLGQEYPQLQLQLLSPHVNRGSSSPQTYFDMQSKGNVKVKQVPDEECHYYDVADDSEYEVVNPMAEKQYSPENKFVQREIEEEKEVIPIAASDLVDVLKNGYLEKKGKERLGGFFNATQKRWCSIKDGVFYYYDRVTDKRQKGQINLSGYEARPVTDGSSKDNSFNKACFELVCPGRKTYQFVAVSMKDMKQWIAAIEQSQNFATVIVTNFDIKVEVPHPEDDINEDIYESLESNASFTMEPLSPIGSLEPDYDEGLSLGTGNDDDCDLYADAESMLTQVMQISNQYKENVNKTIDNSVAASTTDSSSDQMDKIVYVEGEGHVVNPSSWFIGIWDCKGSTSNELDFKRGDLIKIVSKKYDEYLWWIGEFGGKIGLIPRNYITEAYEQIA